ncbi:uncharacterized protein [Physcomitrium patens]|uniref:Uncharacterized protein n=1 Tax=Physcomitrium patens TaxID=3218 RepID=A0A2K1ICB0_PHYPA|nr:uncharacterized protein LOC112278139 [Physcomitrium patens]XP_024367039.1 uncharacterized protein LOC112278139 [Physcomitrium patens]PNR26918.1 hypothetical protein PHYPA_030399 [Physcomitrium patens]|eukprot:XP_024367038.1 uncharacterized protein LOC112278139 [Physcomitrella patens]
MTPGTAVLLATSSLVQCCGTLRRLSTIGGCKPLLQLTGAGFQPRRGEVWSANNLQTSRLSCVAASAVATMDRSNFLLGKKAALYSHSLPAIEAWLQDLGFMQSEADRGVWIIERPDWHAQLSLDYTELYIRYLKSGPGNLDRDVERKFNYALSREDVENAVLGGP